MTNFTPPSDWESVYASAPNDFTFGLEPSQIARTAERYFTGLGGDPKNAIALDLGCGEGRDTVFLASQGMRVVARDIAPTGLEKLVRLLAEASVPAERVDAGLCDARAFTAEPHSFDIALAANIFQFIAPDEVPEQIARFQSFVKPKGICAIGVFSPAMAGWGVDLTGRFTATADELMGYFPASSGWLLLDRTEYWTYRIPSSALMSFAFVVAQKVL